MTRKVYRSLDRTYSLFGLKGNYVFVFLGVLIASVFIALIVGAFTNSIVGSIVLITIGVIAYFGINMIESFYSERTIVKFLYSRKFKDFISVNTSRFVNQWK